MTAFPTFQEDMQNQFEAMIVADLTPQVNTIWMDKLKNLYPEYMQSLRTEMMDLYSKQDMMLQDRAEMKKNLLQTIQNEENAIREAEIQIKKISNLTAQEHEHVAQSLQEIIQNQAVAGQIQHEEKELINKNKELIAEEAKHKSTIESLKKELEHIIKNAG